MTAQIHDTVRWRAADHSLVGVDGSGLFDPVEHGLWTQPTHTANWRGWVARYAVDDVLVLDALTDVGVVPGPTDDPAAPWPPPINGVAATRLAGFEHEYRDLGLRIAFTGRLVVGRELIRAHYVHMGFQPGWRYEHVWELTFVDGRLTGSVDRSLEAAAARAAAVAGDDPDGPRDRGALGTWIARTFSLDRRRTFGDAADGHPTPGADADRR